MNIVNGKKVEYLSIRNTNNGYIVEYSDKFSIVTAHMSIIQKRIREYNINAQIFKRLDKGIIMILLSDMSNLSLILNVLEIPTGAWEIIDDLIVIDVAKL